AASASCRDPTATSRPVCDFCRSAANFRAIPPVVMMPQLIFFAIAAESICDGPPRQRCRLGAGVYLSLRGVPPDGTTKQSSQMDRHVAQDAPRDDRKMNPPGSARLKP